MNYIIVCGGDAAGPEYALGFLIGLGLVAAVWVTHQKAATRTAARKVLPLKEA